MDKVIQYYGHIIMSILEYILTLGGLATRSIILWSQVAMQYSASEKALLLRIK